MGVTLSRFHQLLGVSKDSNDGTTRYWQQGSLWCGDIYIKARQADFWFFEWKEKSMDEQKIEFHDVEDVKEDSTFVEALAQY